MDSVNKLGAGFYYVTSSDLLKGFKIPSEKFVLVSGNEDTTIPDDIPELSKQILESPNLIHWFSQNLNKLDNNKLSAIPIGLHYHVLSQKNSEWGPKKSPEEQEKYIISLNTKPFYERNIKIYCNFKNTIRGRYGATNRKDAIDNIPKDLLIIEEDYIKLDDTLRNMSYCAFVASPLGNGLDCHRTWETLVLGSIPIVKTSILDNLYKELPVLIVNNWSDVNKELLEKTVELFKTIKFNYEKLKLKYWVDIIKNSI
jgi:hypothetical protein